MTTAARFTSVFLAVGAFALASANEQPKPQAGDDWELTLSLVKDDRAVIVGEDSHAARFELTLKNRSRRELSYHSLQEAARQKTVRVHVTQPDGEVMPATGEPIQGGLKLPTAMLESGESVTAPFDLDDFGFGTLTLPGKYLLKARMNNKLVKAESNQIELTVHSPLKEAIVASVEVPIDPTYAPGDGEHPLHVFVQQIKIQGRYRLYHRLFAGDERECPLNATLLGDTAEKVPYLVTGTAHRDKLLFVAFPHTAQGMTVVRVRTFSGVVDGTSIIETPPPKRPEPKPKMPPENRDPNERE